MRKQVSVRRSPMAGGVARACVGGALVLAAGHAAGQNLFFGLVGSSAGRPNYLFTSDLDGNGLTNILTPPGLPVGIDVDSGAGRVFWTETSTPPGHGQVRSSSLSGASVSVTATNPAMGYGLAVDSVNQRVYWTQGTSIFRSDYAGANLITVATGVYSDTVEVDPASGKFFWTDRTSSTPTVRMSNLDGSSPQTIATMPAGAYPGGITVNPATQTVFWSNYTGGTVESMAYTGGPITTLYSGLAGTAGLDYEPTTNRLYMVDRAAISVRWAAPTGGPMTTVFTGSGPTFGEMWDVAAVVPTPGSGTMLLAALGLGVRRRRG